MTTLTIEKSYLAHRQPHALKPNMKTLCELKGNRFVSAVEVDVEVIGKQCETYHLTNNLGEHIYVHESAIVAGVI